MKEKLPKRTLATEDVPLTEEALKAIMPKRQKHNITQSLVDELNAMIKDPEVRDAFRENLMSYSGVLSQPGVKLETYIHAVKYVSYKLMGNSNQESWIKTFPQRYKRLLKMGKDAGYIRSTVACYNRNKVVNAVLEQTLIPTYVLNADIYQEAINTQARLMLSANSEKVRSEAANSLLTHLKQPEQTKVTLDVNVKEDDSIRELREATLALMARQRQMIESGAMTAQDVARGKIIAGEAERID